MYNNNKQPGFTRESPFSFGSGMYGHSPKHNTYQWQSPNSRPENPFLRKEPLFTTDWKDQPKFKKYGSVDKYATESRVTYLPPSKYDIRQKLKQIDQQSWKRQVYEQQISILNNYGSDALRYSTYNPNPPSSEPIHPSPRIQHFRQQKPQKIQPNEYFQDSFRRTEKSSSQHENPQEEYNIGWIKPPPSFPQRWEDPQKNKQPKKKEKNSLKVPEQEMPYDSFDNGSREDYDEIDEGKIQFQLGKFSSSSDGSSPRKPSYNRNHWQTVKIDNQQTYKSQPQQIEFGGRVFHFVETNLN